ncbi:AP-1 complex subunit mu-2 [Selaginella moellendorffii]|uniref:AP-1 complex subunit mu-2 n=1 Tax=Selaginella moellendorffii TaxID=88036 RepID=UPI000D1CDB3F|nr:AP-1 complex subunit mu-2 [Selaginella moellendorffii]XP_024534523.1 AP-1 complex subunit mu-2 [Selaginella moellendorffii]|eukprot:XP_024529599.1 AP-1 complex subunit mu-2 [Selaginella moellendorffii]
MAGAASALFLLDMKGRVLVWRDYRGDVSAAQAERFFAKIQEGESDSSSQDPVVFDDGVTYLFVQHNNVYVMTASRQNCNAASLLLFLHRVIDVFKHYFEELEEESLRDNFVVVYELLDEMMDFGYPQFTEANILSEFIKTDAYKIEITQRPPMAVTNAVSWRSEGIRYKKNEVFLDVVESVNILVNSNGQLVRSDVVGALKMRTYLTGMPECKLGLNDRVLLEAQGRSTKGKAIDLDDIKFHQCVRLARFENDRTISFIPPDGAFDLMTYRLSTQVRPLIWVEAQVERHSRSRVEYAVKARSQFKERSTATNVEIELPLPADATTPNVRTSMGSSVYAPEKEALVWKIKSFPGGKEYMLRAQFGLPSIVSEESVPEKRAPIRVKFEIPYFTVSGIQVRYLKIIEKSGYQALPWVRYITTAGEYELRMIQY